MLSKMKKPSAAPSFPKKPAKKMEKDEESTGKKGSMNECIKRMKSSAHLAIKDKGDKDDDDEMEVDDEGEGGDSVARDKGFALKFQKMKKGLACLRRRLG